jgi:hypothetical protein
MAEFCCAHNINAILKGRVMKSNSNKNKTEIVGQSNNMFSNFNIRRVYDEEKGAWYFSVIDVVAALIEQVDYKKAKSYWSTVKSRLKVERSQVVTNCDHLKFLASDGKMRLTDVATAETMLRIIQSIPSPKAEPIKMWLAKVGQERIQEIANPEESLNRARENWKKHGRSEKWIQQRMLGQETRNKLTDYWDEHSVKREKSLQFSLILFMKSGQD